MKFFKVYLPVCILLPLFLISCSDDSILNLYSLSDEYTLGVQMDSQIVANTSEYPILNNTYATSYVRGILDTILLSGKVNYTSNFNNYNIRIINDDSTVNAFAIPGGFVYVYTGLLKFADNKAELAAVIAHEVGHCACRHSTKSMTKQYGIDFLLSAVLGSNPSALETLGSNLFSNLGLLYYSREDETEADECSFNYMLETPWYAGGMTYFFTKLQAEGDSTSSVFQTLLSTHPNTADRLKAINKLIEKNNIPAPTEATLLTNDYNNFKASL